MSEEIKTFEHYVDGCRGACDDEYIKMLDEVLSHIDTLTKLVESLREDNATLWAAIMDKEEKDE